MRTKPSSRSIKMASWTKRKYLKLAKGFRGRGKNCYRIMIPRVERSLQFAYRGRRLRFGRMRREWIQTISAATREHNVTYNRFIQGLNSSNISLNRKILANLAINEPYTFKAVMDELKTQKGLQQLHRPDMDFAEALERNFLVTGGVRPQAEYDQRQVEYISVRKSLTPEQRSKVRIIH